jgi:hypothetical protein
VTRHPRRVVPACLLALVVLALCTVTAISVIQERSHRAPLVPLHTLARQVRGLHVDDIGVVGAGIVAAVLGLILLACALAPGRAETLALASGGEPASGSGAPVAGISRSGLRTALAATLADVDGVDAVQIRVRARRVTARVRTELTTTDNVRETVRAVAGDRLSRTGLARTPDLRVRVVLRQKGAA